MFIGNRVVYIGDNINDIPNIYTTQGTVVYVYDDEMCIVDWDDSGEQDECYTDLKEVLTEV